MPALDRQRSFLDGLERFGAAPALLTGSTSISYAELVRDADALAKSWGPGRHLVLIACTSSVETVVAIVAALGNGHAAALAPHGADALIERIIDVYRPDVLITDGETRRLAAAPPPMHPDLALLMATSGSTGSSKLVRLSWLNLSANADSIIEYLGLTPADRAITSLPVHYCYGLSVLTTHLTCGASVTLTDDSVADPRFWQLAADRQVTSFAGVPYTFELIERGGHALPTTLRHVTQAGGHMPPDGVRAWAARGRELGFDLFVMYGQTEATARMAYVPPSALESAADAIGQPIPGGSMRLDRVPESDDPEVGELVYSGDNVMMGYAERLDHLAEGPGPRELRTGDLARLGDDGFFRWAGRRSRIAKSFGLRIDLDHLEKTVSTVDRDVACVESTSGIAVFATTASGLLDSVAEATGLPRHAIAVFAVAAMPMTASGKVDYGRLRQLAGAASSRPTAPTSGSREQAVRDAYALVLHRPDASPADSFTSLSGDSLSYVELSIRLADLDVDTSPGWQRRSIAELAAGRRTRSGWPRLDSTIVLRAVAIILIVMNHTHVYVLAGAAHVLLGVAGYNFARFQREDVARGELWRSRWRSLLTVMAPCMAWIVAVTVIFGAYGIDSVLLISGFTGFEDDFARRLWFVEDYFWIQVFLIVLLAVPFIDRLQRRNQLLLASTVLALTCISRLAYTGWHADFWPHHEYDIAAIAWCFAIGWVAALLRGPVGRVILTAVAAASTFGFFEDLSRELVLFAGLAVVIWVPLIPVPRHLTRPLGMVAGASLFIFVSHFQTTPSLIDVSPWLALVVGIVLGVAFERAWSYAVGLIRSRTSRPERSVPPTANAGTPPAG